MQYDKTDRLSSHVIDETAPSTFERIAQLVWGAPAKAPESTRSLDELKDDDGGPPADLSMFKANADRITRKLDEDRKYLKIGDDGKPTLPTQDVSTLTKSVDLFARRMEVEGKLAPQIQWINPPKILDIPPLP